MVAIKAGRKPGSLTVVGVGIGGPTQTTPEASATIKAADRVFYLVTNPLAEFWIQELNPNSMSLHDLYVIGTPRENTYRAMSRRIVKAVTSGERVCAVFYGHPGVLVQASHAAVARLRRTGHEARMLPGISAEACLYADLGVNPGDHGVQSYEATEFLLSRRKADPSSGLILWQIGVVGETVMRHLSAPCKPERMKALVDSLRRSYPANHQVVVYEAPTSPWAKPVIRRVRLDRLGRIRVTPTSTLFIPVFQSRDYDPRVLRWFDDDRRQPTD